jgi:hypothetical protein
MKEMTDVIMEETLKGLEQDQLEIVNETAQGTYAQEIDLLE